MAGTTGKDIRRLRVEKGWSLDDLASASGVHRDTISKIELGKQLPQQSTLRSILDALGEASTERPRSESETAREKSIGAKGEGARVEDRLGDLLGYIGTLDGKEKTRFIRAVITLLVALEHARPAAGAGTAQDDEH